LESGCPARERGYPDSVSTAYNPRVPEPYHFVTDWRFRAPAQRVWDVVLDIERYPGWWKNFRQVRVTQGDGRSNGSVIECVVRGSLPYSLRYALEVMESEEYRHILLRSTGDLVGTGRWAFNEVERETQAIYHWDVATTNPILNLVAPLAKSALAKNHERVMANGYAALRPHVEAPAT
jgi:Polyketide cyclase / dehydrase and lipid transport